MKALAEQRFGIALLLLVANRDPQISAWLGGGVFKTVFLSHPLIEKLEDSCDVKRLSQSPPQPNTI